ncbi:nucleoside deaminase [Pseudooctadecabacter sp.]|uniref:nucleoside deaminase n=1 Tax=Pseudooctadecabacter sp. TaxID=1966338 RepID=UPI0035C83803
MTQPTEFERQIMAEINRWAVQIGADEGPPAFTAAIVKDGDEITRGRNTARVDGDPTHHAEIVTIGQAAGVLGTRDLSGCTLLSSCQPCEMCLAAMRWAKIDRVIFGAQQADIDDQMFRFPGLTLPDFHQACGGCFDYAGGVHDDIVLHLYRLQD